MRYLLIHKNGKQNESSLWDTTPLNLKQRYPMLSLAAKMAEGSFEGRKFYENLGVIKK